MEHEPVPKRQDPVGDPTGVMGTELPTPPEEEPERLDLTAERLAEVFPGLDDEAAQAGVDEGEVTLRLAQL